MAKTILAGDGADTQGTGAPPPQGLATPMTTAKPSEKPPVVVEYQAWRKRPVVIKAFQWFPELGEVGGVVYKVPSNGGVLDASPVIETLEGDHQVTSGDFIITGVKGETYPCKEDIFRMTYEEAKETELADPTKLPEKSSRNMTWVIVRFTNGDSFKIPAKHIARRMVEVNTIAYEDAMRSPAALVKFASEHMGWNELAMVAHGYTAPAVSDRPTEWAGAFKTVEIEPEPKPEKAKPAPASDLKLAKDEDAKNKGKDEDDPENW